MEHQDDTPRESPPSSTSGRPRLGRVLGLLALGGGVLAMSFGLTWLARGRLRAVAVAPQEATAIADQGRDQTWKRGRLVYQVHCARCHGPQGRGDGPDASGFASPPRDLAVAAREKDPEALRRVIVEGVPQTVMAGWGRALTPRELDALVVFVRSFAPAQSEGLPPRLRELLERAQLVASEARPPAPRLELLRADGTRQALTDLRGQVVLVNFWGTTCAPCLKELPDLERLADVSRDRGLVVLPVCVDETDLPVVAEVARRRAKHLPVAIDPSGLASLRFGVQVLPTTVLIGRDGRLLGRAEGARDWSGPAARALVQECLDLTP